MFFFFLNIYVNIPNIFLAKIEMGGLLGKDSRPIFTFSCVNIRNSENINIDHIDGEEKVEGKKFFNFF